MSKLLTEPSISALQLERLISRVAGVISCKVVTDDRGAVREVHVLSASQRDPKQIVRDVLDSCRNQLSLQLNSEQISIAHLQEGILAVPSRRILLSSINSVVTGNQVEVTVELGCGDQTEVGKAGGVKTVGSQQRLLAEATLQALTGFLAVRDWFAVEQVAVQPFAQRELALVAVTMLKSDREEQLVGSAFVRSDRCEAIVRATLDAVNRRAWHLMTP